MEKEEVSKQVIRKKEDGRISTEKNDIYVRLKQFFDGLLNVGREGSPQIAARPETLVRVLDREVFENAENMTNT